MLNIIYKKVDLEIEKKIITNFGEWVKKYDCLHDGEGSYTVAAILNGQPIGFISTYHRHYPDPLSGYLEAFIDVIEVERNYRKNGVAKELIRLTENWAKNYGTHQISAWSSEDKMEAINMWYKLNYCVSPAVMRGQSVIKTFNDKPIYGFYVSKLLIPFQY